MPLENKCTLLQVSPAEVCTYHIVPWLWRNGISFQKGDAFLWTKQRPLSTKRSHTLLHNIIITLKKKRPVPHRWLKIEPWVSASTKTPTPAPMTPPVRPSSTSLATASRAVWRSRPIAIHWWTCHLVRRHRARAVLCALTRSSSESTRSSCATTPLHPVLPSASAGNTTRRIPSKLN